jgi:hypothetical protein
MYAFFVAVFWGSGVVWFWVEGRRRWMLMMRCSRFKPREMEDKWFVYAEGPDEKGVVKLCMCRSWTGARIAEVSLSVTRSLENTVEGEDKGKWQEKEDKDWEARITGLTWESDSEVIRGQEEEGAKEAVREVCKWVLGVELASDNA